MSTEAAALTARIDQVKDALTLVEIGILTCHNPAHGHRSPVQRMGAFEYRGHYLQITQDGDRYNLRIDKGAAVYMDLTAAELNQHIKEL